MKKYWSVFGLFARTKLCGLLTLLFLLFTMTGIELALLLQDANPAAVPLNVVLESSHIHMVFPAAQLVLILWLSMSLMTRKNYTLRRLAISERQVFYLHALYNGLCVFLLWAWQLAVVLLFSLWYMDQAGPQYYNQQSLMINFYENPMLHNLLPLADGALWVRNMLMFAALGVSTAHCAYQFRRRGRPGIGSLILSIILVWGAMGADTMTVLGIVMYDLLAVVGGGICLMAVRMKEEAYDGN